MATLGGGASFILLQQYQNYAEVGSDLESTGEEGDDLVRCGGGSDVEVLGGVAEEQVADAAAGEEGLMAVVAEDLSDVCGSGVGAWRSLVG